MGDWMNFKCPDCGSTLFYVVKEGKTYTIKCYKTGKCGWQVTIENVDSEKLFKFMSTLPRLQH